MISRGKLDALAVVTPEDQHHPMTMAAMDAGLHALCDKALALSADEAKAMYERAEARDLRHLVYFTCRWMPEVRYARELVEQGAVGRLFHCELRFFGGHGRGNAYRWRFDRRRSNGALSDMGSPTAPTPLRRSP